MRRSVKRKSKASRRKKGGVTPHRFTQAIRQQDFQRRFRDLPDELQRYTGLLRHMTPSVVRERQAATKIQKNFRNFRDFNRNMRREFMIENIIELLAPRDVSKDDLIPLSDDQLEKLDNYLEEAFDAHVLNGISSYNVNELLHEANQYHNNPTTYDFSRFLEGGKKKRKTRKKRLTKKRKY